MRKRDHDNDKTWEQSLRSLRNLDPHDLDDLTDLDELEQGERIGRSEQRTTAHLRGRLTEETRERLDNEADDEDDGPPIGDRWSSWSGADARGPVPRPEWVLTQDAAVDTDLGILKTGKEADVSLVERLLPETGQRTLFAAKRYRAADRRLFHRDAGYLEGRRLKESRQQRAVENRTKFGRNLIAQQWAVAEFEALATLWTAGVPVPYPVQRVGTELLVEFLGEADGTAAPRLAEVRSDDHTLDDLWAQLLEAMTMLARLGYTHGDLSPYNVLVHRGEVVLIDLPQLVDVVTNPQGAEFIVRDVRNVRDWFISKGVNLSEEDVDSLVAKLLAEIRLGE